MKTSESAQLRPAPYPSDTRAKGWRFELDYEQIEQSDTWGVTKPEARPWLLMLWLTAWKQTPCGSLPGDHEVIAGKLGIAEGQWARHKGTLLRGWWPADDGRLYHNTLVKRVSEMMGKRRSDTDRQAKLRATRQQGADSTPSNSVESHGDVTRDSGASHGDVTRDTGPTRVGVHPESSTDNRLLTSEPDGSGGKPPPLPPAPKPPPQQAASAPPSDRDMVFAVGVPLLTATGVKESNARSFLAAQSKAHGDAAVVHALNRCAAETPVQPVPWLTAALGPAATRTHGGDRPSKADALLALNAAMARQVAEEMEQNR